jgi:transcriptional regulator
MYIPKHFAENEAAGLELIERHGFGTLIMSDQGRPEISHLPFVLDRPGRRLFAHVARANPIWRLMDGAVEATAVFQGPNAYVSPDWYEKPAAAVPTWNYAAVHVLGRPTPFDDAGLVDLLVRLSALHEERLTPKRPWTVDKLSPELFAGMRKAIVSFALPIERLEVKINMSQNRSAADQQRVREALGALPDAAARETAAMMAALQDAAAKVPV